MSELVGVMFLTQAKFGDDVIPPNDVILPDVMPPDDVILPDVIPPDDVILPDVMPLMM